MCLVMLSGCCVDTRFSGACRGAEVGVVFVSWLKRT